jgi:nucleoside-diphosphate-sugar epimerase
MPLSDANSAPSQRGPVLVTGARGFIGSQILRRLRERRSVDGSELPEIVGLVRSTPLEGEVACDLHDDAATRSLIAKLRPSACVHAAWEIDPAKYRSDERNDRWVETTIALADALVDVDCHWFGAFGTCVETAAIDPSACRYAVAKTTLRERLFAHPIADRLCWWRLFQPYGPGEDAIRFVPSMLRTLMAQQPFTVNAPADARDFIHVSDIAECAVACVMREPVGDFELGTGEGTTLEEAARLAAEMLRADRLVRTRAITEAERLKATRIVAAPLLLMDATGWQPKIGLRGGFASLIARARALGPVAAAGHASAAKGVHAA